MRIRCLLVSTLPLSIFPSVLFAALSVRLLVNLALDPGAGKWGIPDQEGHLAPVDGGARSLVCCHVQRLILARRHYILVHLWIGSLVKCRVASGSLFRRVNAAVPDLGYDNEPSDPRMPFGGIKNSG